MTVVFMPKFLDNRKCYYEDPRVTRYKLTDLATKKDIDSYIDYYTLIYPTVPYEKIIAKMEEDVKDYMKNKDRYTIEDNKLIAIDGKPIEITGEEGIDLLFSKGGFLD